MSSELPEADDAALADTVQAGSADGISGAPTRAASGITARGDATDGSGIGRDGSVPRATHLARVVFALLTGLAVVNLGYFILRFVVSDDRPALHPAFRLTEVSDPERFGALGAFGGWPTTATRLVLVSSILIAVSIAVALRHRRNGMVHLFASLAVLGGQISLAVTVLTSGETVAGWRVLAMVVYGLLPAFGFAALALFPSGRPVPRWSIFAVPLAWAFPAAQAVLMYRDRSYSRPIFAATMAGGLLFLGFLVHRYRHHATLRQRHQIKWLGYAGLTFVTIQLVAVVGVLPLLADTTNPVQPLFKLLYELLLGASYLVALLIALMAAVRYRLWAIDRILNRTLVYALLSLVLGGVLLVISLALRGALYDVFDASGIVAAAIALAVVAVLFPLLRRRITRLVDRRIFGIRIDYEQLAERAMRATKRAPRTETSFAAYDDLTLLGRGGMGAVYRAHHPDFDGPVALKIMAPDLAADPEARARFQREAQVLEGIRHPNVVPFLASGHNAGLEFIAMDFIEGVDLQAILRERGRLSVGESVALLGGVASALDATHALGVVHRDVKPANILVVGGEDALEERRPMLMDFGIARWAEAEAGPESEDIVGSLAYIAPEQIRHPDQIDGRADIYALGVTAYELLTGRPPFRASSSLGLLFNHMSMPPPDPRTLVPELPATTARAVLRALAKDPDERFDTATDFIAAMSAEEARSAA